MGDAVSTRSRGSEWHRWEPHIHAPGTVLEDRYPATDAGWDDYLTALETATPSLRAIAVTDYCVTASYERVRAAKTAGRLPGCDLLFPNIELRLNIATVRGHFVNIHLLVAPEHPDHVAEMNRFLGELRFRAHEREFACTPSELVRLGRAADPSKSDEGAALRHGCTQFKVSRENLLEAWQDKWERENILIAVSGNADGTSGLQEAADATLRQEIDRASHIIFSGNPKQRDFWLGQGALSAAALRDRYGALKPCLWGCDAHGPDKVAKPDGDRHCWVKGVPSFDAMRQACIDPERAYIGPAPPTFGAPSQVVDQVDIEGAPWATTPGLALNPGLVAIIGARGSGKTALADMIATGCDAYCEPAVGSSFLGRAHSFLGGAEVRLTWGNADVSTRPLDRPENHAPESYPRARYLSQQFVEELCSPEGMPRLIKEIERVIFESHPSSQRDGAIGFEELRELRAGPLRAEREMKENALAEISEQIGHELEKTQQVDALTRQVAEKEKILRDLDADRRRLLPKGEDKTAARLDEVTEAVERGRAQVRLLTTRQATLRSLSGNVEDWRQNRAPSMLRSTREQHDRAALSDPEWERFLVTHRGDVDGAIRDRAVETATLLRDLKGAAPAVPDNTATPFIDDKADLLKVSLAVLEAEMQRLQGVVAINAQTAAQLAALTRRMADEAASRERLQAQLTDCLGARARAQALAQEREEAYRQVFEALLAEERVLGELYAPLTARLASAGGTLAKLSFTVSRAANIDAWARQGEEDIFDLRGGPFMGVGNLTAKAKETFEAAWTTGDAEAASEAMRTFREAYTNDLMASGRVKKTDPTRYRPWTRRFARWLYSTDHITLTYGVRYDGIAIEKLSPGTRGIVMILLYLALDDEDGRPLIIDQPEENLDPKSVNDELVPLFQRAKLRRQVIMVTHNANLVTNTDADQIIVAEAGLRDGGGLPPIRYLSGGLEEASIREKVCKILEGGETAFRDRARRLRISLQR